MFAATGSFYSQAVERRIFKPLGMNDASLGLEGIEASPRWAKPHVRGARWLGLGDRRSRPTTSCHPPPASTPASADMAQWLIAQGGHRPDVLPAPLLATLHAPIVATPGEMRGSKWRRERLSSASYALGWRVYDYAGHQLVFHGGAVQGYRGVVALLPERDLGVVILWNSESSLPSGLLPTIIDRAIGLPAQRWLDDRRCSTKRCIARSERPTARPSQGRAIRRHRILDFDRRAEVIHRPEDREPAALLTRHVGSGRLRGTGYPFPQTSAQ